MDPQQLPTVFCLRALVLTEIPFVQTEVDLEQDPAGSLRPGDLYPAGAISVGQRPAQIALRRARRPGPCQSSGISINLSEDDCSAKTNSGINGPRPAQP